jgi:S1-C subfamily serine protease
MAIAAGGVLGFAIGVVVADRVPVGGVERTLVVMATSVVGIVVAQMLVTRPSQRLHDAVSATRLSMANKAAGAVLSLGFAVFMVWMLATALALAPATALASLMRSSAVLVRMDSAVPADAGQLLQYLDIAAEGSDPSRVFTGLGLLPAPVVDLPARDEVSAEARSVAKSSVVQIMGHAECGTTLAGSGVVVAEDLVVTNAHVVAGVPDPYAFAAGRRIGAPGTVVYFDPSADLALLRVPDLGLPPVELAGEVATGELVAVAGYPNGGDSDVSAGRIRGPVTASGHDIYGRSSAQREVLVFAAEVVPGDSGGALLSPQGRLAGVIFAAAVGEAGHTAYALSAAEVERAISAGASGTRVSSGPCTSNPEHR